MQPIHDGQKHHVLHGFPESFLRSLAGNAWESTCAAAMIIVQETLLATLAFEARRKGLAAACGAQAGDAQSVGLTGSIDGQGPSHGEPAATSRPALNHLLSRDLDFSGCSADLDEFLSWDDLAGCDAELE